MIKNGTLILVGFVIALSLVLTSGFTDPILIFGKSIKSGILVLGICFVLCCLWTLGLKRTELFFLVGAYFIWIDKVFMFREDHAGGAYGVNIGILDLLVCFIALQFFFKFLKGDLPKLKFFPKITWPALFFILACTISTFNSIDRTLSLFEIIRLLKTFCIFIVIANFVLNYEELDFLVLVLIFVGVFESLLGISQLFFHGSFGLGFLGVGDAVLQEVTESGGRVSRVSGTLMHPNTFSSVVGFIVPLAFILALVEKKGVRQFFYFIGFFLGLCALMATFTRTNLITTGVSISIVFFLSIKKGYWDKQKKIQLVLFLCLLLVAMAPLVPKFYDRLLHADSGSSRIRIELMQSSFGLWKEHFITGVGVNTYTEKTLASGDPFSVTLKFPHGQAVDHNLFMLILTEIGLLGLLTFLFFLFALLKQAMEIIRSDVPLLSAIGIGLTAGLVGFYIRSFFDFSYRLDQVFWFFWFIVALVATTRSIMQSSQTNVSSQEALQ